MVEGIEFKPPSLYHMCLHVLNNQTNEVRTNELHEMLGKHEGSKNQMRLIYKKEVKHP